MQKISLLSPLTIQLHTQSKQTELLFDNMYKKLSECLLNNLNVAQLNCQIDK